MKIRLLRSVLLTEAPAGFIAGIQHPAGFETDTDQATADRMVNVGEAELVEATAGLDAIPEATPPVTETMPEEAEPPDPKALEPAPTSRGRTRK